MRYEILQRAVASAPVAHDEAVDAIAIMVECSHSVATATIQGRRVLHHPAGALTDCDDIGKVSLGLRATAFLNEASIGNAIAVDFTECNGVSERGGMAKYLAGTDAVLQVFRS